MRVVHCMLEIVSIAKQLRIYAITATKVLRTLLYISNNYVNGDFSGLSEAIFVLPNGLTGYKFVHS